MTGRAARDAGAGQALGELAELDQAWGDEYDLGVNDAGFWARRISGDGGEPEIVRSTAAGLDAALRAGRMA